MNRTAITLSTICCSLIFLTVGAKSQTQLQIRQKIEPLKSTKSDVEKVARFVKEKWSWFEYETPNERLEVRYTAPRCERDGWNVPADRVLYFRVFPKTDLPVESLSITSSFVRRGIDDILTQALTERVSGIQYVIRHNFPIVDHIRFVPTKADQVLRCKGFPIYDPVRSEYSPHIRVLVSPNSDWNEEIGPGVTHTMMKLREPILKSYILVYASKGHFRDARSVQDRLKQIARLLLKKDERRRLRIQFGGYRDATEIETFLLWNNEAPPLPTPTYPRSR